MVVQHNMQAMNASRMLNVTTGSQAKSTEKLSSGYRINRAADDAAGLSISEKMRKQIRGLDRASTNAQDGVSAVQTAEGALTEVHSMLQRMNELAVQAANGTNSTTDRQSIQDEIDQLTTEIDRVAVTTKFNETYLLKGDGSKTEHLVNAHDAGLEGTFTDKGVTAEFKLDSELKDGEKIKIAGKEYTIGGTDTDAVANYKANDAAFMAQAVSTGDSITDKETGTTYTIVDKVANDASLFVNDKTKFTVTYANGETEDFEVGEAAGKIGKTAAKELVDTVLKDGGSVKLTQDSNEKARDVAIVDSLVTTGTSREISSINATIVGADGSESGTVTKLLTAARAVDSTTFAGSAAQLTNGDAVTIGGTKYNVTSSEAKSASDIASIVNNLKEGDAVIIKRQAGANAATGAESYQARTLTVGDTTNAITDTFSVDDILSTIEDGDQVAFYIADEHVTGQGAAGSAGVQWTDTTNKAAFTTTAATASDTPSNMSLYTVVGDTSTAGTSDTITKNEALSKIADELKKASSVGADKEAAVKNNLDGSFEITKGSVEYKDALSFNLHVGADADMTNKITVDINEMSSAYLGVKGLNVNDESGMAATYAIDAIADAVSRVSTQRSALGAIQNRLEHTIANVDNVVENTTAAESRIRDTDMADEMVTYSKNNILAQAGQSMLAQANQSTQGVLSILG